MVHRVTFKPIYPSYPYAAGPEQNAVVNSRALNMKAARAVKRIQAMLHFLIFLGHSLHIPQICRFNLPAGKSHALASAGTIFLDTFSGLLWVPLVHSYRALGSRYSNSS